MKKPIQTAITILLFPLWVPILILMLSWVIASEIIEKIFEVTQNEQ
jgi:hypothetical protein